MEREEVRAEHVEGSHRRRDDADPVDRCAEPRRPRPKRLHATKFRCDNLRRERSPEDLVLRPEARQRRRTCDREAGDQEGPPSQRHVLAQPAHVPHVLRLVGVVDASVHRVDHRAGPEEEACFEKRVREDVEKPCGKRAHANTYEHEPELTDRGIGQHLLQVVLEQTNRCSEQRCCSTNDCHRRHRRRRHQEHGRRARDQVHTRRHHRGSVNERRNGRGTRHRIRKPDVQRDLRALASSAQKQRPSNERRRVDLHRFFRKERVHDRLVRRVRTRVLRIPLCLDRQIAKRPHRHRIEQVARIRRDDLEAK